MLSGSLCVCVRVVLYALCDPLFIYFGATRTVAIIYKQNALGYRFISLHFSFVALLFLIR